MRSFRFFRLSFLFTVVAPSIARAQSSPTASTDVSAAAQKIFVHCKFGGDRTGVMVAAYRIAENRWSAQLAIKKMYSFGFHYNWHPAMESYVRKFPATFATDTALAPGRKNTVK